jgi:ABC-type glycerol-3-phosphate transport system substrate-binding protein
MVPTHMYPTYRKLAEEFVANENSGGRQVQLAVVPVDVDQLLQEAIFEFSNQLSIAHQAWIMYVPSYYQLEQYSGLLDLTNLTASGAAERLWDHDLPELFKKLSESFYQAPSETEPRVLSLPLGASAPLMYYRPAALALHNLTAPRTWSEVLYAARKVNGTDLDGDGAGDYAVCFRPDPGAWGG